ncbi:SN protein, partial [Atractosteus spatula]|nr:SN protein [Atractosteus spatula]
MPDKIPALTGSCVLIPCSYQVEEAFKWYLQYHLTGVWRKGRINVFDSDTKGPDNRWEIPGNLNQNNCTTILRNVTKSDNTTFQFRIEPIKYTYQKGAELTVTDRPRKPTLPPPAEVQEGTPVKLTCTAAAPCPTLPPALTWTPSLNETVEQQEVENEDKTTSVSSVLTFTASHLHHELNITCTALYPLEQSNVTKSSERTVTIRVRSVFCEDLPGFGITMPDKIPALTGSCVLIPCSYHVEDKFKWYLKYHLTGVWWKGGINVFDSDTKRPDNRWEIPGNLNQNNCTTILRNVTKSDNTTIHFRIEPIRYTYQKGAELTVTGRPRKPKLPPPAEVQEGTPVTLTCTAAAPCPALPPALTWTPSLNETVEQQEVENEDKTTSVSSVLTFTASHLHHELNITCTALYPLEQSNVTKSSERTVTIRVWYSPKNTSASVSSSGTILQGNSVTLTCSTNANPPVTNYTWFKVNGSQTVQTGAEQTLTFNITDTDSVQYYCEAQNEHGKENSTTVQLQAEYPPKDTSVSISPSDVVLQDSSVTLTCNSNANPPVRNYTWFKVNEGQVTQAGFGNNLTFKVIKFGDSGQYYCEAKNQHGADNSSEVNVTVKYAPNIFNTSSCIRRTSAIICQCESRGNPPPTIEWLLSGHKVSNGSADRVIKEEQLASGGLKSTLILQITPGNTDDIQNDAGYYRLQFYVAPLESQNLLNWKTLLIGGAIGAVLMSLLCCLLQCFQKRKKDILRPSLTKASMEDTAELIHMNGEQQVQTNVKACLFYYYYFNICIMGNHQLVL